MSDLTPRPPLHDRYDILRPLGRGGMAMVFLAREVDTGREVALKHLVVPGDHRPPEWRLRFQQEFHLASGLKHPNVVATYDYAEPREGQPFFTMELLPGPGLDEMIPLAPARLLSLLPGLLAGLAYLHNQGLVHCDLKPDNIRMGADGQLRLMDLGLVTRAGQPTPGIQGTLPYLAPEVIRRAPADRRSDLYALGAVCYHLLAGHAPFIGDNREVLLGHLELPPTPIDSLVTGVPPELAALIMRMLAKEPIARFQSASEALRFLGADAVGTDDQTLFHPPLVGRRHELQELQNAYKRTRTEGYQEVWVHGEPGAGLGEVLDEFCCRAQILGAQVVRGAFRPRMAPFEGLRPALRGLVALARSHSDALDRITPLVACIDPEMGVAEYAPEVDPQQELLRLYEALTQLVRLVAGTSPVVLAFDQAHFADAGWRDWLGYMQRNAQDVPVIVVMTHVGEPTLDFDPCRVDIPVRALALTESQELCQGILGQADVSETFTRQIFTLSGGRPQRVDQLLRGLVGTGRMRRAGGQWVFPEEPLESLVTVSDPSWATTAASRAMPPLAAALIETLAMLGRDADMLLLWSVAGRLVAGTGSLTLPSADGGPDTRQSGELFEALNMLVDGGWVAGVEGRYSLHPDRPREAVLEGLDPLRRRKVHSAIAEALRKLLAVTPGDLALASEVAGHALGAGDRIRGPVLALSAATLQARLFGLHTAEALLKETIGLLEMEPASSARTLLPFYRLRADVARQAGDRRLAQAMFLQTLVLAESAADVETQARAHVGFGRLRADAGDLGDAARHFNQAILLLDDQPIHAIRASALTQLGRCALTRGDLAEARNWVEQALRMARLCNIRTLIRENMAQLGYLYVADGGDRAAEGLGLLFEALQLIERDEAKIELNACHAMLGSALLLLGRYAEAKQSFLRNCDLCAEIGAAPHDEAIAYMRRAQVALEVGDYREAQRAARPAGALARMIGNKLLLAQVRLLAGLASLHQGEYTMWQDAAGWVEETLATHPSDNLRAMWDTSRGEAEGHLGQWTTALSSANGAIEAIERGAGHEYLERAQLLKGEALTRLGLYKPARQALAAVREPRNEALQARLLLARAILERHDGKQEQALMLATQAHEHARRSGALPIEAACCLLVAQLSPDREEVQRMGRQALLHAELCGSASLEAESLGVLASAASRPEQAEWFWSAAAEAWRRVTAQLPPSLTTSFGTSDDRKLLRDGLARRAAAGYRVTNEDYLMLLDLLAAPPTLDTLFEAIVGLCRERGPVGRIALFYTDEPACIRENVPSIFTYSGGIGPSAGDTFATARLMQESAERRVPVSDDGDLASLRELPETLIVDLKADGDLWGALAVTNLGPDAHDCLAKLLPHLQGALWAARQLDAQAAHSEAARGFS